VTASNVSDPAMARPQQTATHRSPFKDCHSRVCFPSPRCDQSHSVNPYRPRVMMYATVVALGLIVHWGNQAFAAPPLAVATNATLPPGVAEMRDTILLAVNSGRIEELRVALELNEMRPDVADAPVEDIIGYWRQISKDGQGRDILAALGAILALPPAKLPLGRDIENNAIYVWPALAERDLSALSPADDAALAALVPADEATALKAAKRWTWWRIAIGADGTWHSFRRDQ
jgi:hypothetical protein